MITSHSELFEKKKTNKLTAISMSMFIHSVCIQIAHEDSINKECEMSMKTQKTMNMPVDSI